MQYTGNIVYITELGSETLGIGKLSVFVKLFILRKSTHYLNFSSRFLKGTIELDQQESLNSIMLLDNNSPLLELEIGGDLAIKAYYSSILYDVVLH